MIDGKVADKNASSGSSDAIPCLSRVLKSLVHYIRLSLSTPLNEDTLQQFPPTHFEKLALRRIHCFNLTTRHTKEGMIEKSCIFIKKEPASCSDRSRPVLVGMVEAISRKMGLVPLSPAVPLILQQLPQSGRIFDATSPSTSYMCERSFSMTSSLELSQRKWRLTHANNRHRLILHLENGRN